MNTYEEKTHKWKHPWVKALQTDLNKNFLVGAQHTGIF